MNYLDESIIHIIVFRAKLSGTPILLISSNLHVAKARAVAAIAAIAATATAYMYY